MADEPLSPMHSPNARGPAEVETELEDNGNDLGEEEDPAEVEDEEEDLCSDTPHVGVGPPSSSASAAGSDAGGASGGRSTDYAIPTANREVWKAFGHDTEAGRLLKKLYKSGSHSEATSKIRYPRLESPSQRWEPKPAPRKACPQRAVVKVPQARRPTRDPDDPRYWRAPLPGRKPASEIFAEMEAAKPQIPDMARGRDQGAEKNDLQNKFQFCGGRALPKSAMGYVPDGDLPKAKPRVADERRVRDENNMTVEHREIAEELMRAIKWKQERIAEIDAENAKDTKFNKVTTTRNKEALELRNDIDRCLRDIDKLFEITA